MLTCHGLTFSTLINIWSFSIKKKKKVLVVEDTLIRKSNDGGGDALGVCWEDAVFPLLCLVPI